MYKVVCYYDDVYPILIGEFKTLDEAKERQKEAYEKFDLVKIFHEGEEVKWHFKLAIKLKFYQTKKLE